MVSSLQQQQQQVPQQPPSSMTPTLLTPDTHTLNPAVPPSTDPLVVQDLMAQMQGTYNFMQVGNHLHEHLHVCSVFWFVGIFINI